MKNNYASLLNEKICKHGFLVLAHRGLFQGNIVENTVDAMQAAFNSGADAVEIDVIKSTDGDFFVCHDGCETRLFKNERRNLNTISTQEINKLYYCNNFGILANSKVNSLSDFFLELPSEGLINLDRGWYHFKTLLPFLDTFDILDRLLLKAPAVQKYFDEVASNCKKYMFFAICKSKKDVELALINRNKVNLVGIELVANTQNHSFLDKNYIKSIKSQGLYVLVNTLTLGKKIMLWGNYDDNLSILVSPDFGWGMAVAQGVDIINTDWPAQLVKFREETKTTLEGIDEN